MKKRVTSHWVAKLIKMEELFREILNEMNSLEEEVSTARGITESTLEGMNVAKKAIVVRNLNRAMMRIELIRHLIGKA